MKRFKKKNAGRKNDPGEFQAQECPCMLRLEKGPQVRILFDFSLPENMTCRHEQGLWQPAIPTLESKPCLSPAVSVRGSAPHSLCLRSPHGGTGEKTDSQRVRPVPSFGFLQRLKGKEVLKDRRCRKNMKFTCFAFPLDFT